MRSELINWNDDGYAVLKSAIPSDDIDLAYSAIYGQLCKFSKNSNMISGERPWQSDQFHEDLIALRSNEPISFAKLYDSLQSNAILQSIALNRNILEFASSIFSDKPEKLSATGVMLRLDVPKDTRNTLSWHQERSYYDINDDGSNGVVAWIPLQDCSVQLGSIQICPGSHKEGFIDTQHSEKKSQIVSEQFTVQDEIIRKYKPIYTTAKKGDAVVFSMNTIHASGFNTSTQVRFSLTVRLHRATVNDFHPGRLLYTKNFYE